MTEGITSEEILKSVNEKWNILNVIMNKMTYWLGNHEKKLSVLECHRRKIEEAGNIRKDKNGNSK